jgi:hypothetical protein
MRFSHLNHTILPSLEGVTTNDSSIRLLPHRFPRNLQSAHFTTFIKNGQFQRRGVVLSLCQESLYPARAGERYTVHVHYQPDPVLRDLWGCVYLECGGSV